MLIEMASMEVLSHKAAKGQSSVLFVLDEARFLPPLDAISDGPSIGRGYGVYYLDLCAGLRAAPHGLQASQGR
jgi:type IV secretory pathway TraG/TraD family ATPase VirD4